MIVEVEESKRNHVHIIARQLRKQAGERLLEVGLNARKELIDAFMQSSHRRSLRVEGRIVAMGGAIGTLASSKAFVWVAITEEGLRHARPIVKTLRTHIEFLLSSYDELITNVPDRDKEAVRFAKFLGFEPCRESIPGMSLYILKRV